MEKSNQTIKVPVTDARDNETARAESQENMNQEAQAVEDQAKEAEAQQIKAQEDMEQELESQQEEAEAKEEEADYKDLYMRTLAEFENFRRRSEREIAEFKKYANEVVIKELLPVIDNLERALECSINDEDPNCAQNLLQGVELTQKEILKLLERHGVTQISAVGETFDPAYHQALMAEESDEYPEETVIREMQKGYLLKERLIRPALVAVSKGKASA